MQCLAGRARSRVAPLVVSPPVQGSRPRRVVSKLHAARSPITTSASPGPRDVAVLPSWDPLIFEQAYSHGEPARLPRSSTHLPPACSKWFIHEHDPQFVLCAEDGDDIKVPRASELHTSFWSDSEIESAYVPLEITTKAAAGTHGDAGGDVFEQVEAPLMVLLAYLAQSPSSPSANRVSMYLAQCELSSLPERLQRDLPTPELLRRRSSTNKPPTATATAAIKGDIYASSLWMGRPPTYTPLHRDPNPNLFVQLAGRKTVRLLPPDVGDALFREVTTALSPSSPASSPAIRGEEMMAGPQKAALHHAVWDPGSKYAELVQRHGQEVFLQLGDALFTPKGWWHSVKGIGDGVTASVNWWFR